MIKIINIYDNIKCKNDFIDDWGFSCVIQHPNATILFDTGANPEILRANLETASIQISSIDIVIISHKHWDHIGGILWIAKENPNAKIYMPKTWNNKLKNSLLQHGNSIISVNNSIQIDDKFSLIFSKNLFINELALTIKTSNGIIVVTGCSHTGIEKIVSKTLEFSNKNIFALIGGFHMFRSSTRQIKNIANYLKQSNIKCIAPCHCTGERAIQLLTEEFEEKFHTNGVGAEYYFVM